MEKIYSAAELEQLKGIRTSGLTSKLRALMLDGNAYALGEFKYGSIHSCARQIGIKVRVATINGVTYVQRTA